ncbi:MAG: DEAD/DEAH box helicase family protein, partial [Porticoccaceae bacterium]
EKKGNKIIELGLSYWLDLDEYNWSAIKQQTSGKTFRPDPRTPRDHQKVAIKEAKKHFIASKEDRGRLIMPCASGKSLTAYWIAKELKAKSVIVAVPSLSLIKQTVKDWTQEYTADKFQPDWICICSDRSAGKLDDENDDFVKDIYDLGLPVTTNRDIISAFLKKESKSPKIIFITYMSSPILAEEAKNANCSIDFCIFDEAHKTAGRKDKRSTALLNQENINIKKRLFMTATERILSGSGKNEKAYSMNDKSVYGGNFHTLTFKKAIDQKIICDYKIITMAVSKPEIDELIDEHKYVINEDGGKELLDAASLAAGIALDKTIKTYGAKHAISFHRSIPSAKHFNNQQALLTELDIVGSDVKYSHISSKLTTGERSQVMSDFVEADKSVMTNAKCLTEGVDIPAIDCVLFASPKQSIVDIVQAAGRAMRPDNDNGKKFGYILIPIVIPDNMEFEDFASTTEFKVVAKQLAALSSQDERIAEYFRLIDKGEKPTGNPLEIIGDVPVGMNINFNDFASAVETKLWNKIGKVNWRPFEEAREFARNLRLTSAANWHDFSVKISRPSDIPSNPQGIYSEWVNWGDWLGTGSIATALRNYLSFAEARSYVHSYEFSSGDDYKKAWRAGSFDKELPSNPHTSYKESGWISWPDFLGSNYVPPKDRVYLPFSEARTLARSLNLQSQKDWFDYWTLNKLRAIPRNPYQKYSEWISWPDWLNNGNDLVEYWSFEKAREYVQKLENVNSHSQWIAYCESGQKPAEIPKDVRQTYKKTGDWTNDSDFFRGDIARKDINFLSYEDAKVTFVHPLKLSGEQGWRDYKRQNELPLNIPKTPENFYQKWAGWPDWVGSGLISNRQKSENFVSFNEAKAWAIKQNIRGQREWRAFTKSPDFPDNIPKNPNVVYSDKGWNGEPDFFGYEPISGPKKFRDFAEAQTFAQTLGLSLRADWQKWLKTGRRPHDIPAKPNVVYKDEGWDGWTDFLQGDK